MQGALSIPTFRMSIDKKDDGVYWVSILRDGKEFYPSFALATAVNIEHASIYQKASIVVEGVMLLMSASGISVSPGNPFLKTFSFDNPKHPFTLLRTFPSILSFSTRGYLIKLSRPLQDFLYLFSSTLSKVRLRSHCAGVICVSAWLCVSAWGWCTCTLQKPTMRKCVGWGTYAFHMPSMHLLAICK